MTEVQPYTPDAHVFHDGWSDLRQYRELPDIDMDRLFAYRTARIREQMKLNDVAALVIVNPLSLSYAAAYDTYQLYQSHLPSTYLFMAQDGPTPVFGGSAEGSPPIARSEPADSTAIVTLVCDDLDSGVNDDLVYAIASGNGLGQFAVSAAGVVSVVKDGTDDLDFETTQTYSLEIQVSDSGTPALTTTVQVNSF